MAMRPGLVEMDEAPGCPLCYLATGKTLPLAWDEQLEDWVCPRCEEHRHGA
jgi:rubredoxin